MKDHNDTEEQQRIKKELVEIIADNMEFLSREYYEGLPSDHYIFHFPKEDQPAFEEAVEFQAGEFDNVEIVERFIAPKFENTKGEKKRRSDGGIVYKVRVDDPMTLFYIGWVFGSTLQEQEQKNRSRP